MQSVSDYTPLWAQAYDKSNATLLSLVVSSLKRSKLIQKVSDPAELDSEGQPVDLTGWGYAGGTVDLARPHWHQEVLPPLAVIIETRSTN